MSALQITTAQRSALLAIYERLTAGQDTTDLSMVTRGCNARTLDALERKGLVTWLLAPDGWKKRITLTPEGLAWCAGATRYCPRCRGISGPLRRTDRRPVTVGYEPAGTRSIGDPIKAPCPCRWHDDGELAR